MAFGAGRAGAQTSEPAAPLDGRTLYQQFCLVCHSPNGRGGPLGATLVSDKMKAAPDADLIAVVTEGRIDQGMPSFGRGLSREEVRRVTSHVRGLQDRELAKQAAKTTIVSPIASGGDLKRGEALFNAKAGCIVCHSVFYSGGLIGPDLSYAAREMTAGEIYESVATPSKRINRRFRSKEIIFDDGRTIKGRFRNETRESIQILNYRGDLWTTYLKSDAESVRYLKQSLMPEDLLSDMSQEEVQHLFAFLNSLK